MKELHLDNIIIWNKIGVEGLFSKKFSSSLRYNGGVATKSEPVFAYSKDYTKGKRDFSLTLYTHNSDEGAVESLLDNAIKKIKVAEILEAVVELQDNGIHYTNLK